MIKLEAPEPGTLARRTIRVAISYLNSTVPPNAHPPLVLRDDYLIIYDCAGLGRALKALITSLQRSRVRISIGEFKTGNDNQKNVLKGLMELVGLQPNDYFERALAIISASLSSNGCNAKILTTTRRFTPPQILKLNYMENISSYLTSKKVKKELPALTIILSLLGLVLSNAGVVETEENRTKSLLILPSDDLLSQGASLPLNPVEVHNRLRSLARRINKEPPLTRLVAFAAMLAEMVAGVVAVGVGSLASIPDHIADEYLIQRSRNRVTLINSSPFFVRSVLSNLLLAGDTGLPWLIRRFIEAAGAEEAVGGRHRMLLRNVARKVANHVVAYTASRDPTNKYLAVREVTALRSLLIYGGSEQARHVEMTLRRAGINDPVGFLSRLASALGSM